MLSFSKAWGNLRHWIQAALSISDERCKADGECGKSGVQLRRDLVDQPAATNGLHEAPSWCKIAPACLAKPLSSGQEPIGATIWRIHRTFPAIADARSTMVTTLIGGILKQLLQTVLGLWLRLAAPATRQGCKRALIAMGLSLLLSTQVLFQENVFQHFSIGETLEGMWQYFLDILAIAVLMMCAMSWIDWKLPVPGSARNLALLAAVAGSVLLGMLATTVARYGTGPYPPEGYLMGDATRWMLAGGAMTLIYETLRRHQANLQQLHAAELRHQVLGNQMMQARINMMEAQIEPHFLFNTLATVKRLYRTEPVDGAHVMARLKAYLQAALPQIRHGLPTLASELELVRNYLEILQVRMGPRLEFSINAPAHPVLIPLPAMLLVTLVENAIKHGLNPSAKGGSVAIQVFDLPDAIAVEVRDDGVGFQAGAGTSGSGIGLVNLRSRLAALYGTNASLILLQNHPVGVIARIEVDKQAASNVARQTVNLPIQVSTALQGSPL